MAESLGRMAGSMPSAGPVAAAGRWRPAAGFAGRVGRRTLLESVYL